jgi:diaminopimelate epimerase
MSLASFLSASPPDGFAGKRPFVKMQGLRNHFVFVEERGAATPLTKDEIVRLCDVHVGIGAEQVIGIAPPTARGIEAGAYAFMRIYNIDGSEAEACGNATRCMARLLFEETGRDRLVIESPGGLLDCKAAEEGLISVTLGPISTDWRKVPLSRSVDTSHLPVKSGPLSDGAALSIGNPHAVYFVPDFDAVDIPVNARSIAADPLFPESVNVGVAQVLDEHTLRLAVWERPGMLTEACGTGACVAAHAARMRGLVSGDDVTVKLPGGTLDIRLLPGGMVTMTGPASFCCAGYA